jgi:hypothetical protein
MTRVNDFLGFAYDHLNPIASASYSRHIALKPKKNNCTSLSLALPYQLYVTYLPHKVYGRTSSSRRKFTEITTRILRLHFTIHYLFVVVTFKTSIHRTI